MKGEEGTWHGIRDAGKVCEMPALFMRGSGLHAQLALLFMWMNGKQIWGISGKRCLTGSHANSTNVTFPRWT